MNTLYNHYSEKKINKIEFLFRTVSPVKAVGILFKEIRHYIKRIQRK